jgi:hypothetical protein
MGVRRLLSILAAMTVALLLGALPAQAGEHGSPHGDDHPSYPPKPASISISQTRVVVGGTAVVTARGCQPGTTATVKVLAPGGTATQTQQVVADSNGKVRATVTFTRLGANRVTVTCLNPFGRWITLSVKVNVVPRCAIWADHDVVREHGHVQVTVTGHERDSRTSFAVMSGDRVVYLTTATANANGVATVALPLATAGSYTVRVVGLSTDGPVTQTLPIAVLGGHREAALLPISLGGLGLLLLLGTGVALAAYRRRPAAHTRP